ncbi:MAG: glutamine synthetase III [Defluviitaleaceae bacterium]|nr:glutamine synthetase III [Defluviitaleaceae bacterium]
MSNIQELFGSMVFNETVMQARLPKNIFKSLKKTMTLGQRMEIDVANVVATAMKDWAIERGATHFTHWFQPMTGVTAEKHDSFIEPSGDGKALMEFSGKSLVHGESDASSFPSGGLRATFEARGYTIWDTTSYAFVRDGTLYIPTAFCSYSGESLDEKTPLLRSMEALNTQAMRILKLFGNSTARRVIPMVGAEQEYFLVDKAMYHKRTDLVYTGRTLFGARPPKAQEMDDHYYGSIKPRVAAFMKELDQELWKLGVYAKTKHNEAAPSQHELALIYDTTNIATDHNQLTMDMLQNVASRHNLVCLLHEKPFAGVNGSGKHNNWSLATDTGINLLEPGKTPHENAQFILFLVATIKAVDEYADLLRASAATASNDHRLGANEAPPSILSMFLGDELTEILEAIRSDEEYQGKEKDNIEIGVTALPNFTKDTTDRNRTSPFAFTGNKFEFRMPGSSLSIAEPNIVLNTIVAEALRQLADQLEAATDFKKTLAKLLKSNYKKHSRIIFNGNSYAENWLTEAQKRGLSNHTSTVEALAALSQPKAHELYTRHNVFTPCELQSRFEIYLENYCKTINIEAFTFVNMVNKSIIPAVLNYQTELAKLLALKQNSFDTTLETRLLTKIATLSASLAQKLNTLEEILHNKQSSTPQNEANHYSKKVFPAMQGLRETVDELEKIVSKKHWGLPSYGELLHSVI